MRIVEQLGRAFREWWARDRVRVSPFEGRLLKVTTPCVVRIDGEEAILCERQVRHVNGMPRIEFQGYSAVDQEACALVVDCDNTHARWQVGANVTSIPTREIVIVECHLL